MFATPTQIGVTHDERNRRTVLELIAADRPGLLSEVGKVFVLEKVELQGARIVTVGERAEDVFYLTDARGEPLDVATEKRVTEALLRALDRQALPAA
jgi:[protein-PII] uridylyltransferase